MRGLPYSGKSKKAMELAGDQGRIHSANDYFMVNGVYRYDVRQIHQAHLENQEKFKESLAQGIPIVICDNCNVKIWEFQKYIDLAREYGYSVEIITMPHHLGIRAFREKNWRNIPHDKFMAMYYNFESIPLPTLTSV